MKISSYSGGPAAVLKIRDLRSAFLVAMITNHKADPTFAAFNLEWRFVGVGEKQGDRPIKGVEDC